jgi:NADP-dependent 3-hydroxy acid dehydrogenase YdfG
MGKGCRSHGGYDILINNAGVEITSLVVDLRAEDLRRMCDVNSSAPVSA